MSTADRLIEDFNITTWIINKQAEGLTNEQMMLQPPFRGNCFNWVLGHIVETRDRALKALGQPPTLAEDQAERYRRGSDPITEPETAVPGDQLLAAMQTAHERIAASVHNVDLEAIFDAENSTTVADRVASLHWHETYHTGQLELLRQLAGTNDRIIG